MSDLFGDVCPCCGQPVQAAQETPFDAFWQKWPDKRAKMPAEKAWLKLAPAERQVALDRCEGWCRAWRKRNPEASHIMASTYLNQRRFLDEPDGKPVNREDAIQNTVAAIKSGKYFLCINISAARARALVLDGHVTQDECRKAGVL